MTQVGEAVAFALIDEELDKCPFKAPDPKPYKKQKEDILKDDRKGVRSRQANNGGILGSNLNDGCRGAPDTIPDPKTDDYAAPDFKSPRVDSNHPEVNKKGQISAKPMVKVANDKNEYPYIVAAHHLIPGNAALEASDLYNNFMKKGGKIDKYTIQENIGYNVNGSHNGVWLPGNYAIRRKTSPCKKTWSILIEMPTYQDWCYNYMVAVVRKADGQFHDTHTEYSENVLECLDKITLQLYMHLNSGCKDCKSKTKIPPPYQIKSHLYLLSQYFRKKVTSHPRLWKLPWVTSDRFKNQLMQNKEKFLKAYEDI